jgi:molecular chaperone GrpE (heat shock protein)
LEAFVKLEVVEIQQPESNVSDVSPDDSQPLPTDGADLPAETLEGQLAAVTAERDQLLKEKAELYDRVLRARAEFENARRRAERERLDSISVCSKR